MRINATNDLGKYFGIASIDWGKMRNQALAYIHEHGSYKIQGLHKSILSYVRCEVMIKAVLNAISIFPINHFKFPLQI